MNVINIAAKFICAAKNHLKHNGVREHLVNILFPFFKEKLNCGNSACGNSTLVKIITEKFANLRFVILQSI